MTSADSPPGYRRRIIIRPEPGQVRVDLEDDYHCMAVIVEHADGIATAITAEMTRVPWTTCPGARDVLAVTFTGVPLEAFAARGAKQANCTHLHDLALLAGAHARDAAALVYDLLVSDPQRGKVTADLRRDGDRVMTWHLADGRFETPRDLAGLGLGDLRAWIDSLDETGREHARLLRWGTMLAHGRARNGAGYDTHELPRGQCYTFQPERADRAVYLMGTVREFSRGDAEPLAALG